MIFDFFLAENTFPSPRSTMVANGYNGDAKAHNRHREIYISELFVKVNP